MLDHIKVVELASVLAGPDVGMFFAELGAQVIKIENKLTGGDVTRNWKSSNENKENSVSAYFSAVNYGKTHLLCDLSDPIDRDKIYTLIKDADIVIANFKPGSAKKLGMDYKKICSINPSIIYGEINGYGKESKRAAYDVVLQAETGFMSINGTQESGPLKMPIALIDVLAAHQLKEGILLALMHRLKSGKGAFVEVSLYDAAVSSLKNQATNWLMNNTVPKPIGSLHPNIAPYGETFTTKDDETLVLAIGNNKHFNSMLEVLGASNLVDIEKFATNQLRVINRKELYTALKNIFITKTKDELMHQFIHLNIPVGVVRSIDEVFENENAKELILEEEIEGQLTKRVRTGIFKITEAI